MLIFDDLVKGFKIVYRQIILDENYDYLNNRDGEYDWITDSERCNPFYRIGITIAGDWIFEQNSCVFLKQKIWKNITDVGWDNVDKSTHAEVGYFQNCGTYNDKLQYQNSNTTHEFVPDNLMIIKTFDDYAKIIVKKLNDSKNK